MRDGRPVILIVYSNEDVRTEKKQLLERQLYHVSAQKDAKQAMDYIKSHQGEVDLMITELDLHSLNGNGLDLVRMLGITGVEGLPVVLIIDDFDKKEYKEAIDMDLEDVFNSNLDDRVFVKRIRNIVNSTLKPGYVNVMEEALETTLKNNTKELGICLCRACRNDVMTLALNNINPRYVSSEKGKVIAYTDAVSRDNLPQLLRALTESAEKIKKNPRHVI